MQHNLRIKVINIKCKITLISLLSIFIIFIILSIVRYVQIMNSHNVVQSVIKKVNRGDIYDRYGEPISFNQVRYNLIFDASDISTIKDDINSISSILNKYVNVDSSLYNKIHLCIQNKNINCILATNITYTDKIKLESKLSRHYFLSKDTIRYVTDNDDLKSIIGYTDDNIDGKSGIELFYNKDLSNSKNITTTIDKDLSKYIYTQLSTLNTDTYLTLIDGNRSNILTSTKYTSNSSSSNSTALQYSFKGGNLLFPVSLYGLYNYDKTLLNDINLSSDTYVCKDTSIRNIDGSKNSTDIINAIGSYNITDMATIIDQYQLPEINQLNQLYYNFNIGINNNFYDSKFNVGLLPSQNFWKSSIEDRCIFSLGYSAFTNSAQILNIYNYLLSYGHNKEQLHLGEKSKPITNLPIINTDAVNYMKYSMNSLLSNNGIMTGSKLSNDDSGCMFGSVGKDINMYDISSSGISMLCYITLNNQIYMYLLESPYMNSTNMDSYKNLSNLYKSIISYLLKQGYGYIK